MYSSRCCDDNIYNKKDTPRQYFKVPEELLVSQSHRFRIITNFVPRFSTLLQCRQLTALTLFRTCPRSCHLVKTNPFLKTLAWFGQVPYSGYFSDLETDSFSNLKSLENLTLNQWSLSAEDLVPILWRNQKTLRRLELKLVQGLDVFDSVTILSNFQEQEAAYMEEDEPKITTLEALALERLEELVVDVEWPENPGLLELITEFCPNLKTLTLSSSLTDDKAMMIILENRLKESNPLLRMEKISHGAQYSHFA
ncbi:hypothetical protein BGZ46_008267 [Entomortierella lignicola]|nr:hypothetical protein BGZ46_008267 [Entomortierella lignicola]